MEEWPWNCGWLPCLGSASLCPRSRVSSIQFNANRGREFLLDPAAADGTDGQASDPAGWFAAPFCFYHGQYTRNIIDYIDLFPGPHVQITIKLHTAFAFGGNGWILVSSGPIHSTLLLITIDHLI